MGTYKSKEDLKTEISKKEVNKMKKIFLERAFIGFPLGISIGYVISIVLSVVFGNGYYSAVHPDVVIRFGNEINAVIIQAILWGIIGFNYSGFSVIWQKDNWSLVKQTVAAFFAYLLPTMIVGYILNWFTFNILEVLSFIIIYIVVFVIIWIITYFKAKKCRCLK